MCNKCKECNNKLKKEFVQCNRCIGKFCKYCCHQIILCTNCGEHLCNKCWGVTEWEICDECLYYDVFDI